MNDEREMVVVQKEPPPDDETVVDKSYPPLADDPPQRIQLDPNPDERERVVVQKEQPLADDPPQTAPSCPPDGAGAAIDLEALRSIRGERGRFLKGVPGPRLLTGDRAMTLLEQPDVAEAHRARAEAITADLGGMSQLSAVQVPLVAELARLQLVTDSLGADVLARGTMTGKGRTRAAVTLWLTCVEKQQRLAQLLGLERRSRSLPTTVAGIVANLEQERG